MKSKIELDISKLSSDVVTDQIGSFLALNSKELSGLVMMNKEYYSLFKQNIQPKRIALSSLLNSFISGNQQNSDELLKAYPEFQINQLLWYVVSGNQVKAEEMLKQNPKLLLKRGSIIDMSGRHFNNITPFELVLWNMDVRYMAGMMLNCIPDNEDGNEISKELLSQYNKVEENGVNYTVKVKVEEKGGNCTVKVEEHNESHFSYQPLINKLQTYVNTLQMYWNNRSKQAYEKCGDYWRKEVGKAQFMLTIEGRNQYCHLTRSFDPRPNFNEEHLERNLKVYNYVADKEQIWDSRLTGLGRDFGILRTSQDESSQVVADIGGGSAEDLAAISLLSEVRTKDLGLLKKRLELSIQKSEENQKSRQLDFGHFR